MNYCCSRHPQGWSSSEEKTKLYDITEKKLNYCCPQHPQEWLLSEEKTRLFKKSNIKTNTILKCIFSHLLNDKVKCEVICNEAETKIIDCIKRLFIFYSHRRLISELSSKYDNFFIPHIKETCILKYVLLYTNSTDAWATFFNFLYYYKMHLTQRVVERSIFDVSEMYTFFSNYVLKTLGQQIMKKGGLQNILYYEEDLVTPTNITIKVEGLPYRITEIPDEERTCAICLDEFNMKEKVLELSCKHYYHEQCIRPWLSIHTECPYCKREQLSVTKDIFINCNCDICMEIFKNCFCRDD